MPADDDTKKFLEEVKKGKPRRFVMICKGVKILSLIVYKKGTVEKYKKQAKEEGKGQFYHGVVDGKGVNVTFKLALSDGYDKPPGKELILKDFLSTETGIKFKPTYEIVESLPELDLDDESDSEAVETTEDDTDFGKSPEVIQLGKRFNELSDPLKSFVATFADRRVEILKPVKTVKDFLAAPTPESIGSAQEALKQIETLVLEMKDQGSTAPTSAGPGDFKERLKALLPQVKELADSSEAKSAKTTLNEAGEQAKKNNFESALQLLDEVENILKKIAGSTAVVQEDIDRDTVQPVDKSDLLAVWIGAKDSVNEQLNSLTNALKTSGHPYLEKIAENGVHHLPNGPSNVFVTLQASLLDYNAATGTAKTKAGEKLLNAVAGYQKFIDNSVAIEILDTHKLCGPLTLRRTLKKALITIDKTVRANLAV